MILFELLFHGKSQFAFLKKMDKLEHPSGNQISTTGIEEAGLESDRPVAGMPQ